MFSALQNTNALFSDTKLDPSIEITSPDLPALRRQAGFPFLGYGFRSDSGKAIVAYWFAAHSRPGNVFPPLYADLTLKNTGIARPALIDIVSGEIKPLKWKQGTTDTVEALPITDSVMAIADESYFDWPVLPEAPSSLNVAGTVNSAKLTWEVHGGSLTGIVVERRNDSKRAAWQRGRKLRSLRQQHPRTPTLPIAPDRASPTGCVQLTTKALPPIRISCGSLRRGDDPSPRPLVLARSVVSFYKVGFEV